MKFLFHCSYFKWGTQYERQYNNINSFLCIVFSTLYLLKDECLLSMYTLVVTPTPDPIFAGSHIHRINVFTAFFFFPRRLQFFCTDLFSCWASGQLILFLIFLRICTFQICRHFCIPTLGWPFLKAY